MLFGSPALAGASGALIRVVYDHWRQGVKPRGLQPAIMTTVLGFWASGVAGALFVLPQVLALNGLQRQQANRLLPFAALIGLLAGLTLEKVFPRLIRVDVPIRAEAIEAGKGVGTSA